MTASNVFNVAKRSATLLLASVCLFVGGFIMLMASVVAAPGAALIAIGKLLKGD